MREEGGRSILFTDNSLNSCRSKAVVVKAQNLDHPPSRVDSFCDGSGPYDTSLHSFDLAQSFLVFPTHC